MRIFWKCVTTGWFYRPKPKTFANRADISLYVAIKTYMHMPCILQNRFFLNKMLKWYPAASRHFYTRRCKFSNTCANLIFAVVATCHYSRLLEGGHWAVVIMLYARLLSKAKNKSGGDRSGDLCGKRFLAVTLIPKKLSISLILSLEVWQVAPCRWKLLAFF